MRIIIRLARRILKRTQKLNDKLYEKEGLTDKVLINQLRINRIRSKLDLEDEDNIVTDDGYVQ